MTAATLKPCPFCGAELVPNTNQRDLYVKRYGTHYMHANNGCLLDGNELTPSEVEGWNKRTTEAELAEELKTTSALLLSACLLITEPESREIAMRAVKRARALIDQAEGKA